MKRNKASKKQQPEKSTAKPKICRICLSNSSYRDICNDFFYCGKLENYGQMLKKTYNIPTLKSKKTLICDECVDKLRDATEFKQKVLTSDDYLSKLSDNAVEIYDSDLDLNSDISNSVDIKDHPVYQTTTENSLNNTSFLETVKTEVKQDPDFEILSNENDDENYHFDDEDYTNDEMKPNGDKEVTKIKPNLKQVNILRNKTRKKSEGRMKKSSKDCKKKPAKKETLDNREKDRKNNKEKGFPQAIINMQENTHNLIINSNLCLFKSLKTKFGCYDCKETFFDIKELRQHVPKHFDPKTLKDKCKRMTGLTYKNADISNLKCKICSETCPNLEFLKCHLEQHGVKFTQNGSFLIPFKLEEGFKCVLCEDSFNTFTRLSIHMHSHSTHNVCEICGNSYFNRSSLRTHIFTQHKDKKCSKCNMVFTKMVDRMKHLKKVHGKYNSKRYCLKCSATFKYTHLLAKHNIEVHGAEKKTAFCQDCGKKFASAINLNIHIRSVHLKERNYACSVCEMRFFTTTDRKRHERIHGDERCFSCSFCNTKFKTKDSVRRHLRRQHGHLGDIKEKIS